MLQKISSNKCCYFVVFYLSESPEKKGFHNNMKQHNCFQCTKSAY